MHRFLFHSRLAQGRRNFRFTCAHELTAFFKHQHFRAYFSTFSLFSLHIFFNFSMLFFYRMDAAAYVSSKPFLLNPGPFMNPWRSVVYNYRSSEAPPRRLPSGANMSAVSLPRKFNRCSAVVGFCVRFLRESFQHKRAEVEF